MYTLGRIADHLNADVVGDVDLVITGVGSLEHAQRGEISHFSDRRYRTHLAQTRSSAVILRKEDVDRCPTDALVVSNPYFSYAKVSQLFADPPRVPIGIHETAFVDASANIGEGVRVGPFVSIGHESVIEDGVEIASHAAIGPEVSIGQKTVIKSHATVADRTRIGEHCTIMEGCVIGADGFGYATDSDGTHCAIAQLGAVRIGNHVDIGAKTTIDRGALDDTVIQDHVKIDDQVHIGHNCQIGEGSIICGCAGMAGSVTIGKYCMIGGGVGIAGSGPLTITDQVYVSAMTFVSRDISQPGIYSGHTLHTDNASWRRNAMRLNDLDQLYKRVNTLERLLKEQNDS